MKKITYLFSNEIHFHDVKRILLNEFVQENQDMSNEVVSWNKKHTEVLLNNHTEQMKINNDLKKIKYKLRFAKKLEKLGLLAISIDDDKLLQNIVNAIKDLKLFNLKMFTKLCNRYDKMKMYEDYVLSYFGIKGKHEHLKNKRGYKMLLWTGSLDYGFD